jgi:hypothetical protein
MHRDKYEEAFSPGVPANFPANALKPPPPPTGLKANLIALQPFLGVTFFSVDSTYTVLKESNCSGEGITKCMKLYLTTDVNLLSTCIQICSRPISLILASFNFLLIHKNCGLYVS